MTQALTTVGILYAGELGASVGSLLRTRGVRVVTTLKQRSHATAQRCGEAGLIVLESLVEVIRQSDVIISLVLPAAAEDVAAAYCDLAHLAPPAVLYVDVNSISPDLAASLAAQVERRGRGFIDAAINGLATNLASSGTLFLSGARADEVARLFDGAMRIQILGADPGRASAMKMLLSGLSKGVCALFTELALLADRQQMLPELVEASARIYPGIWALVERMLPTYPRHAARRATEMAELEQTAQSAGLEPCIITAIRHMHDALADVSFDSAPDAGGWTVASLIRQLSENRMLTAQPSTTEETHTAL
jgi:3-hydroxyisobutyrate dehydrogenase-like beta-hydroxyacid dehydrogenase